jgi:hypothetical protein
MQFLPVTVARHKRSYNASGQGRLRRAPPMTWICMAATSAVEELPLASSNCASTQVRSDRSGPPYSRGTFIAR